MAQVDYFLKFDTIPGESRAEKYREWIEIDSFQWGIARATDETGKISGKVSLQDFHFTSRVNKASPLLMFATADGTQFPDAVLAGLKSGEDQFEFLLIKMKPVFITSYQTGGSSGDVVPVDSFSLNFASIAYKYTPQDETGKAGAPVERTYDFKRGTA